MAQAPRPKGERRLDRVLQQIPIAREQLLAAIEDLGPGFNPEAIETAMQSGDPRERNKVAVIERELDLLIAYLEELASRGLAEGQRLDVVPKGDGRPWDHLAELRVISAASAARLQSVKEMRNELAHAYPPTSWRALHQAVENLLAELDAYKVKVADWLDENGILTL
ncbi:MAG TPA: HepT-like ribonuclease domain-containing protein [Solirubrobacteraceae bacterium]|nr:HepT-like ribonuclease domain-containing protein [Solirubrobacteraceae bacterium]